MEKKRSGRPKKADSEKVQYQRIAVYRNSYEILIKKLEKRNAGKPKSEQTQLTDAFDEMVKKY